MEKFLRACWNNDKLSGESNDNSHDDFLEGTLFHNPETSNKKELVKDKIKSKILSGEISDNLSGFKFTLSELCLPILFTEVVKELEKNRLIKRVGSKRYQSTGIHAAPKYTIEVLKDETIKDRMD